MNDKFPWLPIGTEIYEGAQVGKLISDGNGFQIIASKNDGRIILLISQNSELYNKACNKETKIDTLLDNQLKSIFYDNSEYRAGLFSKKTTPVKVQDLVKESGNLSSVEFLSIANAISEMTEDNGDAYWDTALYFNGGKFCLATESKSNYDKRKERYALAVRLLVGFIPDANISVATIKKLNPDLTLSDVREFLSILGFDDEQLRSKVSKLNIDDPGKFSLPGRPLLEHFFKENIIDYFYRYQDYQSMGIQPPNGILLYGPTGSGKTHTAKALADFLDWPVFEIDVGSIGSPYIHQTSKLLKEVFEKATENAPSIILMEEIDALSGSRTPMMNDHKIEEIAQLLRLMETASKQGVLVLATTNRYHSMDDAIVRKGRFDYILEVDLPQKEEIILALEGLLVKKPVEEILSREELASKLVGHPMSDVAWAVNEAARVAVRSKKKKIDSQCFEIALKLLKSTPQKSSGNFS